MLLQMEEVNLYIIHTQLIRDNLSFVLSYVDDKRREKAERYVNEKDNILSLGAGYLIKKYLPKETILVSKSGKPYLMGGPFFNISHSGDYAVLAINPSCEVGIDIEQINEKKLDAIRFISNDEEKLISDKDTLFKVWSNKESITKCLSTGLRDIRHITGLPLEGSRIIEGIEFYTKSMIYDGYSLSITLKTKDQFSINIQRIENIEK